MAGLIGFVVWLLLRSYQKQSACVEVLLKNNHFQAGLHKHYKVVGEKSKGIIGTDWDLLGLK